MQGDIYRQIALSFWTDGKVDDEFTPEDKYFYLYLLTNPHTNLCGCYEISFKQFVRETGYNDDTIVRLLKRMEYQHNVIRYCKETKEVLILNWHRYNWSKSPKLITGVQKNAEYIKYPAFKEYVLNLANSDTVSIPYPYTMDTTVTDTVTDTVSVTATVTATKKAVKHKHGEYDNVLLTDEEFEKLKTDYPYDLDKMIDELSSYMASSGKSYKSHYATLRNWFTRKGIKKAEEIREHGTATTKYLQDLLDKI